MYLGIDIGGTKTLIAALDEHGVILVSIRIETPKDYDEFLAAVEHVLRDEMPMTDFRAGCVAAPGQIDHEHGKLLIAGNLPWKDVPLARDIERLAHCPMLIENDAKLAGLSEAMLLKDTHARVLYLTISTGIGGGMIVDRKIDRALLDMEPGQMMLQRGDKYVKWESFASGRAITARYGKRAADINSKTAWRAISKDIAIGMADVISITQPDVVVIGGGVGTHLHKFHDFLVAELKTHVTPLVDIPPILQAQRPEEAVVYGCYDLARSVYA